MRRFGFVQWEFAGRLGPEPGRYAVRRFAGDEVQHVVVIGGLAAPRRAPFGARRPRPAGAADEPLPVDVTRATVVETGTALADHEAAEAWLARALEDDAVVRAALGVLTRAVAAQRVAAADPWLADPDPARALATRVGYGDGEEVAAGEWEAARELPLPRPPRRMTSPGDRVALLLGGRDVALACEELAIRARADLDRGRRREAALQLDAALGAALAELEGWRGHRDIGERLTELAGHREPVAEAARAALAGGLEDDRAAAVEAALGRLEAALRARAAG
ncbi:MAG: hypothetical protein QOF17_645 [Solirubrobacteraceae bacterium]|nr:hypothetical protein [Solirubrobacteraceae bacterium]